MSKKLYALTPWSNSAPKKHTNGNDRFSKTSYRIMFLRFFLNLLLLGPNVKKIIFKASHIILPKLTARNHGFNFCRVRKFSKAVSLKLSQFIEINETF